MLRANVADQFLDDDSLTSARAPIHPNLSALGKRRDQIHDFDYTAKVENGTCSGFHLNSLSSQNSINFSAQLVTEKFVKRGQYFCHVYNKEANFSTNPTFANVSGNVYSNLTGNPTTFITSVGLLNNAGEVLAVAKVAPVVKKDFNSETVFKINLDY